MKFRDNAWKCQVDGFRFFASLRMTQEDGIKERHHGSSSYLLGFQAVCRSANVNVFSTLTILKNVKAFGLKRLDVWVETPRRFFKTPWSVKDLY